MANTKRYTPNKKQKVVIKGSLLYVLPFPIFFALFFALIRGNIKLFIFNALSFALFMIAAIITRHGLSIEKEYKNSSIAVAPKFPYKTIGALFLTAATFVASYFCTPNSFILSIVLAVVAFISFYMMYGFDPRVDKVNGLNVGTSAEEVIKVVKSAKDKIDELINAKFDIDDLELELKLDKIITESNKVIEMVEKNPNDLSRARKFFNVYLDRTKTITNEFVKNKKSDNIDEQMRTNYLRLLENVEKTIQDQQIKLNSDDLIQLDVQIDVLTKQLKNEGV